MTRHTSCLDADVIVVNYNAGTLLLDCVASALESGVRRVIVVDNASADGSIARLRSQIDDKRLQIILNDRNLGFAVGCNMGVKASDADYLLFMNPDCVLPAGTLPRMIEVLEQHPEVGMAGGFLCNMDGSEQPGGRREFPTPGRAFARAFGLSAIASRFPGLLSDFLLHDTPLPSKPVPVEAISGACMLVKRQAMDDVGLWDEGYFLHCEDLDWCMRFQLKHWQILFVPDAPMFHAWRACSRRRPIFVEWHKHRGMLRFYRKFFRSRYPGALWWLMVTGVWLRFAVIFIHQGSRLTMAHLRMTRHDS